MQAKIEQGHTLEDATTFVAEALGLDVDILVSDYLAEGSTGTTAHAISRNITQLLPANGTLLDSENSDANLTLIIESSTQVAEAIAEAIEDGGNANSVVSIINEEGDIITKDLTVDDAKAFIADVRTWANEIDAELNAGGTGFVSKIETAKPLFETDSEQLLMHLNTYATALIEHAAVKVEEIELDINHIKAYELPLAPNTVGDGMATGSMFIEWHDDITTLSATIDIMHNGDMVQLFLVLNLSDLQSLVAGDRAELSVTAHGLLSNDKASIEIIEDSHITVTALVAEINEVAVGDIFIDGIVFDEASLILDAKLSVEIISKVQDGQTAQISFLGAAALSAEMLQSTVDEEVITPIPTLLSLIGEFKVGENQSFSAELTAITDTGSSSEGTFTPYINTTETEEYYYFETADSWVDLEVTLKIAAEFIDTNAASIEINLDRKGIESGIMTASFVYGDRSVDVMLNTALESVQLTLTNGEGIVLTLVTKPEPDSDGTVGILSLGADEVGKIRYSDGLYVLVYNSGEIETLM